MMENNPVVALCVAGTQAEFRGQTGQARGLYRRAWELAGDDFEACVAAHYMARHQSDPEQRMHWNLLALQHAEASSDGRVRAFYPSLYVNMGYACELLGQIEQAQRYYEQAAALGLEHDPNGTCGGKNRSLMGG